MYILVDSMMIETAKNSIYKSLVIGSRVFYVYKMKTICFHYSEVGPFSISLFRLEPLGETNL